ncbi:MAG: hypothetical protein HRU32_03505 [Rhodobacteraceae bacterium]|nr:hypothetical protein [Paracoccaceae bacterium]
MSDAPGGDKELELQVSPPRHMLTVAVFSVLAFFMVSLGIEIFAGTPLSGVFLLVLGALAGFMAWRVWQARSQGVVLTRDALITFDDQVLCTVDDIDRVERSIFAVKPSGGFRVKLKSRHARGWVPGVWWRSGKSIGIGGITISPQARAMADVLAARLAIRDKTTTS